MNAAHSISDLITTTEPQILKVTALGIGRAENDRKTIALAEQLSIGMEQRYTTPQSIDYFLKVFPSYTQDAYNSIKDSFSPRPSVKEDRSPLGRLTSGNFQSQSRIGWVSYWPYTPQYKVDTNTYYEKSKSYREQEEEEHNERLRQEAPQKAAESLVWALLDWKDESSENLNEYEKRRVIVNYYLSKFIGDFIKNAPVAPDLFQNAEFRQLSGERVWFAEELLRDCAFVQINTFTNAFPGTKSIREAAGHVDILKAANTFYENFFAEMTLVDQGKYFERDTIPAELFRRSIIDRFGSIARTQLAVEKAQKR